jgi:hypothetical protein
MNKSFLLSALAVGIGLAFPVVAQADTLMVDNGACATTLDSCSNTVMSSPVLIEQPLVEKTIAAPVVVEKPVLLEKTIAQPVLAAPASVVMERPIIIKDKPRRHLFSFTLF